MDILVSQAQGKVPVAILQLKGDLDASSYQALISEAQKLYDAGNRNLLLDLTGLAFISSAGLASLHIIAKMYRGEKATTGEDGWDTFRAIDHDRESGMQTHVKLLNPSPDVDGVLDTVGFKQFFEIYSNRDEAVNSFGFTVSGGNSPSSR